MSRRLPFAGVETSAFLRNGVRTAAAAAALVCVAVAPSSAAGEAVMTTSRVPPAEHPHDQRSHFPDASQSAGVFLHGDPEDPGAGYDPETVPLRPRRPDGDSRRLAHRGPIGSARGASCSPSANLIVTGNVLYAEPGCGDGSLVVDTAIDSVCTSRASSFRDARDAVRAISVCVDRPLKRARVELYQVGFLDPVAVTATDDNGDFAFCLENPNSGNQVDIFARVRTCGDQGR